MLAERGGGEVVKQAFPFQGPYPFLKELMSVSYWVADHCGRCGRDWSFGWIYPGCAIGVGTATSCDLASQEQSAAL